MHGFQLWANLPASLKMTDPRYQDIAARDIPLVTEDDGTSAREWCGEFWGREVRWRAWLPTRAYVDISVPPGVRRRIAVEVTRHALRASLRGSGTFRDASAPQAVRTEATDGSDAITYDATNHSLVLFDRGDEIVGLATQASGSCSCRGVARGTRGVWHGPIVMNTQAELQQAFTELACRHLHQAHLTTRSGRASARSSATGLSPETVVLDPRAVVMDTPRRCEPSRGRTRRGVFRCIDERSPLPLTAPDACALAQAWTP